MLSKMNNAMRRELIPTEGTPPKSPDPEHGGLHAQCLFMTI